MNLRVSVIVSTLNRPDQIVPCVREILASPRDDFELVVVDQSPEPAMRKARTAVGDDQRLRWISSATRGLSRSRNIGIAETRAPIIAFTDDDCRVESAWVEKVAAAFDADPTLGMLFGAVVLRPEDRAVGYAAEFEPTHRREYLKAFPPVDDHWGVGANMSIRRTVLDRVGLFDPVLGAGAPLRAAEETDVTIRAIAAGFKVALTPDHSVVHLGVRSGDEAGKLMRGYGIGVGAALSKHVRLGTPGAKRLLASWVGHHGKRSLGNALRGDRHPGFGLVAAMVYGAVNSVRLPLDRPRRVFVE